jgi:Fic family protein
MNKWNLLAEKLSELHIVQELTQKQQEVAALRPFSADLEGRIMQKLRLDWNYHSNAIEGNPMSYGETITYLMYGLTAKGKTLKDHLDIRGHNEAIYLMASIVKEERGFSETDIRELHSIILVEPYHSKAITPDGNPTQKLIQLGQYKTQPNHVKTPTGELHRYAEPEDVPIMMGELMEWYRSTQGQSQLHPAVIAALFHHRFVNIHPFDDGNGRLGRILMNLILMQHGYPPAIIKLKDRATYIDALINANAGDYELLINYICESLNDSLNIYLRAASGERVEEMGDVDKEISLFVRSFDKKDVRVMKKTPDVAFHVLKNSIFPFLDMLIRKLDALAPIFLEKKATIGLHSGFKYYNYPVNGNGDRLTKILNQHQEQNKEFNIEELSFTYEYEGFKKSNTPFDYWVKIQFRFEKMQYKVVNYNKIYKIYLYSQLINLVDRNELVETIVKETIQEIQKNAQS